jgi:hypothetical protein
MEFVQGQRKVLLSPLPVFWMVALISDLSTSNVTEVFNVITMKKRLNENVIRPVTKSSFLFYENEIYENSGRVD